MKAPIIPFFERNADWCIGAVFLALSCSESAIEYLMQLLGLV